MWIGFDSCAELLWSRVTSPGLRIRDEEPLFGSVPVDNFSLPCSVQGPLQRIVCDNEAAEVGKILPKRELTVHVDCVNLNVPVELIDNQLCLLCKCD
jgi:hypothetical protein